MNKQIETYKELNEIFSVYPLNYQGKETYDEGWSKWCYEKRPFDEAEFIIAPGVYKNCGVLCGPASGIIVIDVDDKCKFEAWCTLRDIKNPVPETFTIQSRPDRYHYYCQYPLDGIEYRPAHEAGIFEVLATGSLVVSPGSIHKVTKKPYTIIKDLPIAPLPEWARLFLIEKNGAEKNEDDGTVSSKSDGIIPVGGRNNHLTSLAGSLLNIGLDTDSIKDALLTANQNQCSQPLEEKEVLQIHKSMTKKSSSKSYYLTDSGNAELFVDQCQDNARFCPENKTWYLWREGCWRIDKSIHRRNLARDVLRDWSIEGSKTRNKSYKDKLLNHARKSEGKVGLENMLDLAQSFPQIHVKKSDLDNKEWLLNVLNGTIDLKTGQLGSHNKSDYFTELLNISFDLMAVCPEFVRFLKSITGNDPELMDYLQKCFGYALTGNTDEQVYFILVGEGSNGKSTLLNVFSELMGYLIESIDFNVLCDSKFYNNSKENQIAQLEGKRFVTSIEVDSRKDLDQTLVNKITGGDSVRGKLLYKDSKHYIPQFKLFVACNHLPKIAVNNHATWRRIRVIPFNQQFEGKSRVKKMKDRLVKELPGILNWAVEGCLKWQKEGLKEPKSVVEAIKKYREESDPVAKFLAECCISNITGELLKSSELSKAHVQWCEANGLTPMGTKKLSINLISKGFSKSKVKGCEHWINLQLKSNLPN